MRIDAHGHACGEYVTADRLVTKLSENRLDQVVLFPGETGSSKIQKVGDHKHKEVLYFSNVIGTFCAKFMDFSRKIDVGNAHVYRMRQEAPDRIVQYYWVTPRYVHKLEQDFQEMQFAGIKLHQCIDYFGIHSDFLGEVLDFAELHNLPILIHLYGRKDASNLIDAIKERDVTVTIAHLFHGKVFEARWQEIESRISFDLANYYLLNKSTAMRAINTFGCGKLILGADNPYGANCIEKTLDLVASLPVTESDKAKILGENMQKILGN